MEHHFLAMLTFTVAMAVTPGPNNIMVTASGVNFGFRRSIPHILGVTLGFAALQAMCGLGLGAFIVKFPAAQIALKVVGAIYLLWLAWKVANAGSAKDAGETGQPLTFLQAAAFQWVNVKAVTAALSAVALFVRPATAAADLTALVAVGLAVTIVAISAWAWFGVAVRQLLRNPRYARIFNIVMALLLVASIVPMVM